MREKLQKIREFVDYYKEIPPLYIKENGKGTTAAQEAINLIDEIIASLESDELVERVGMAIILSRPECGNWIGLAKTAIEAITGEKENG